MLWCVINESMEKKTCRLISRLSSRFICHMPVFFSLGSNIVLILSLVDTKTGLKRN